jgi:hypothetical protein
MHLAALGLFVAACSGDGSSAPNTGAVRLTLSSACIGAAPIAIRLDGTFHSGMSLNPGNTSPPIALAAGEHTVNASTDIHAWEYEFVTEAGETETHTLDCSPIPYSSVVGTYEVQTFNGSALPAATSGSNYVVAADLGVTTTTGVGGGDLQFRILVSTNTSATFTPDTPVLVGAWEGTHGTYNIVWKARRTGGETFIYAVPDSGTVAVISAQGLTITSPGGAFTSAGTYFLTRQ